MIPKNIKILIALCLLTPINSKAVSRIVKKSLNYEDFLATIDLPKAWPKKAGKVTASNGQCLGRTRADQVGLVHCDYAIEQIGTKSKKIYVQLESDFKCLKYVAETTTFGEKYFALKLVSCKGKNNASKFKKDKKSGGMKTKIPGQGKKQKIVKLPFLNQANFVDNPPYYGTLWHFDEALNDQDTSTFDYCEKVGIEYRQFWDYRNEYYGWNYGDCWIVDCYFNDGLKIEATTMVNRDYTSHDQLLNLAVKYSKPLGRCPKWLRQDLSTFAINGGNGNAGGNRWRGSMNGNQIALDNLYNNKELEELFLHELGHVSIDMTDNVLGGAGWKTAQVRDPTCLSNYGCDHPDREDVSETIAAWMLIYFGRATQEQYNIIMHSVPNRINYLNWYLQKHVDVGDVIQLKGDGDFAPNLSLEHATPSVTPSGFTPIEETSPTNDNGSDVDHPISITGSTAQTTYMRHVWLIKEKLSGQNLAIFYATSKNWNNYLMTIYQDKFVEISPMAEVTKGEDYFFTSDSSQMTQLLSNGLKTEHIDNWQYTFTINNWSGAELELVWVNYSGGENDYTGNLNG